MKKESIQTEIRFNNMLNQAYKSLECCQCERDYNNVMNGWARRLLNEFEVTRQRHEFILTLVFCIRYERQNFLYMQGKRHQKTGHDILKQIF